MKLRDPIANAHNHGSARDGTGHWWAQRYTAILLVPLTLWMVWALMMLIGANHAEAAAWIGRPWNAVMALLFVLAMIYHGVLGLQVIIEDYIHQRFMEVTLQLLVKTAGIVGALMSVVALMRLAVFG